MKKLFLLILVLIGFISINAAEVSGTISANTTWTLANSPYIVTNNITVNAGVTLTIENGVEVRFADGRYMVIAGGATGGTLSADNVAFTSNTGTTAGLWNAIYFDNGSTANLSNCSFQYATHALRIRGAVNMNIDASCSFNDISYNAVYMEFRTLNSDMTLPKLSIPYWNNGNSLNVANGAKLSIEPGVVYKFNGIDGGVYVDNGSLHAVGTETEPIIFTSSRDDSDGTWVQDATAPAVRNWRHIRFMSGEITENRLEHCIIRYAGYSSDNWGSSALDVRTDGVGVTIKDCRFENNQRSLSVMAGGTIHLENSSIGGIDYPISMRADGNIDVINSSIDFTGLQNKAIFLKGTANITANAHLKALNFINATNIAYYNDDWIGVPESMTMTIDPGVVIKGVNNYGRIEVHGELLAEGTADKPIVFTSMHDDNYSDPADSNNNGVATTPALNQWGGIIFHPTADNTSSLRYCNFRYSNRPHGVNFLSETVNPDATISIFDVSPTVENCSFFESNHGIKVYGTASPLIQNCSFENIKITPVAFNASATPQLVNNTWGANIKYRALGLMGQKTGTSGRITKIDDAGYTNLSYLLLDHWQIIEGVNVEIDPGVVIKVNDGVHIHVRGGLKAVGTVDERITFTERRDDNFGTPADLEGDGNATTPAARRWGGICFYNSCDKVFSQIKNADFRFGGGDGLRASYTYTSGIDPLTNAATLHNTSRSGVLTFSRTAVNIEKLSIFNCGQGLAYYGSEAVGKAVDVTIEQCDYMPIVQTWSAKPQFTNLRLINNAYQGIFLQDNKIDYNITLGKTAGIEGSNTPDNAVYLTSDIEVAGGVTVQVDPGLIFKNIGGSYGYTVKGVLQLNGTADERITLTSVHDDSKGGDSNNNGNATSPAKGNWAGWISGINFNGTTGPNSVKYTDLSYAGNGISFLNATALIEDCRIEQCSAKGVSIEGTSNAVIRRTAFNNMQVPVRKNAFSTASLHEDNSASNVSIMGIELIGETFNTSGTLPLYNFAGHTDISYWLTSTLNIGAGTTLTIPAGASFKFSSNPNPCFNVLGTLNISGTADKKVVITDEREDGYGSPLDFNQDGTVTQEYGRLDRVFIDFKSGSAGTLQHLILKSNGTGINITAASPIIKNVVFDNLGRGVSMTGIGSAPVIENSVFNNSTYPLETSLLCFPASLAGNTFSGTSYKGIKVVAETLNQNVSLAPRPFGEMENAPYIFDNYTVNAELTITPGVKCKFLDGRGLTVNRWLKAIGTAESPVVFTSIRDDYYGGDTNADGAATPANASYWNGITFADATIDADCILSNVIVKNAYEAVTTNNASPQLTNVTFYTNRNAVQAVGASNPLITNCDFVGQSQRAVNNVNQSFIIQATNCWWDSNEGPVVAASPSGNRQAVSAGVNFVPFRTNGLNQPLLGDVSSNGVLQAYDASLVLQAAVGTLTLEAHQVFAADVSGDGLITAYDATLILEYVAGLRPNMPGGLKSAQAEGSKPTLRIASGDIYRESDLYLPINLEGTPPSVGVDIVLSYDPSLLQAVEVVPMSGSGFMQAVRIDNLSGRLYLAAAATKGQADSEWNLVRFRLMDKLDASSETAVSADLFRVNEINLTAAAISGTVRYNVITGINASSKSATLTCYPNPASDILYLSGATMGSELSIFDGKGQKLQSMILTESSINLSSLNSGLYYIVITNNKDTQRAKFLKK
ncbi:MAG TPA: hypothetical protein DDW62_00845 [Marinilabiliaceae bacterium]|nr:hypothetical protein [Marinilabiliaceae bacterium]